MTAAASVLAPHALVQRLDAALPQTQCTRCGYAGCAPYARAMANGEADIDRCPPGGDAGAAVLAAIMGRVAKPVDRTRGEPGPLVVAVVDEAACIGCTLCIAACPVDAIVGAQKRMHAVLPSLCSGCELCVPACPVDCIDLVPAGHDWTPQHARAARERFDARNARVARLERIANRRAVPPATANEAQRRQDAVAAALARARARRAAQQRP